MKIVKTTHTSKKTGVKSSKWSIVLHVGDTKGDVKHGYMVANILAVAETVTPEQWQDGANWYPKAFEDCIAIAQLSGVDIVKVAGVVAAISPMLRWDKNLRYAQRICVNFMSGKLTAENAHDGGYGVFGPNVAKAVRILSIADSDAPEFDIVSAISKVLDSADGPKIKRFFLNIVGRRDVVTIDRHAARIAFFPRDIVCGSSGNWKLTSGNFTDIESAYLHAAQLLDVCPVTLQAATWCTVAASGVDHETE